MYDIQRGKSINESFPISLDEGIYLVDSSYDYNQIVKIYNKGLINLKFRNYVFKNELVFAVVIFKYQKMPTGTKFVLSGLVRINDKTIFLNLKVHNIFKNKIFCAIVQLQLPSKELADKNTIEIYVNHFDQKEMGLLNVKKTYSEKSVYSLSDEQKKIQHLALIKRKDVRMVSKSVTLIEPFKISFRITNKKKNVFVRIIVKNAVETAIRDSVVISKVDLLAEKTSGEENNSPKLRLVPNQKITYPIKLQNDECLNLVYFSEKLTILKGKQDLPLNLKILFSLDNLLSSSITQLVTLGYSAKSLLIDLWTPTIHIHVDDLNVKINQINRKKITITNRKNKRMDICLFIEQPLNKLGKDFSFEVASFSDRNDKINLKSNSNNPKIMTLPQLLNFDFQFLKNGSMAEKKFVVCLSKVVYIGKIEKGESKSFDLELIANDLGANYLPPLFSYDLESGKWDMAQNMIGFSVIN